MMEQRDPKNVAKWDRSDAPPRDDGCELSPKCTACPLPLCRYDDPGAQGRRRREARNQAIRKARDEDMTVLAISERFGISERAVYRILADGQ